MSGVPGSGRGEAEVLLVDHGYLSFGSFIVHFDEIVVHPAGNPASIVVLEVPAPGDPVVIRIEGADIALENEVSCSGIDRYYPLLPAGEVQKNQFTLFSGVDGIGIDLQLGQILDIPQGKAGKIVLRRNDVATEVAEILHPNIIRLITVL